MQGLTPDLVHALVLPVFVCMVYLNPTPTYDYMHGPEPNNLCWWCFSAIN